MTERSKGIIVGAIGVALGKAALAILRASKRMMHNAEVEEWRSTMDAAGWRVTADDHR